MWTAISAKMVTISFIAVGFKCQYFWYNRCRLKAAVEEVAEYSEF